MRYEIVLVVLFFMILVSIQYILNKILLELRRIRKVQEMEKLPHSIRDKDV